MNIKSAAARGFKGFIVYFIIGSAVTSFAGLSSVPIDFSHPKQTLTTLAIAFIAGFLLSLGKLLRDAKGNPQGGGAVNTLTP